MIKSNRIEFYLIDSFEIFHYLPLYNMLLKLGCDVKIVAEPPCNNVVGDYFDYETSIKILHDNHIDYASQGNVNSKIAITTQRADILKNYRNYKLNLMYSYSFLKSQFFNTEDTVRGFDGCLVYSEYAALMKRKISCETKIFVMGCPKHDNLFHHVSPERIDILNELSINTKKKILLYLPTYDAENSISLVKDCLISIKDKFFIVTKPHHCTYRFSDYKNDLDVLRDFSDILLDGNFSFQKSCLCADLILSDAKSGASLESIYINPVPAIFITPREKVLESFYSEIFDIAPLVNNTYDLDKEIQNFLQGKLFIDTSQLEKYMGPRDGMSTVRAVRAIQQFLSQKNKSRFKQIFSKFFS